MDFHHWCACVGVEEQSDFGEARLVGEVGVACLKSWSLQKKMAIFCNVYLRLHHNTCSCTDIFAKLDVLCCGKIYAQKFIIAEPPPTNVIQIMVSHM